MTDVYTRRRRLVAVTLAALSVMGVGAAWATDEPLPEEKGPFFGDGNIPALCVAEMPRLLEDGSPNPDYWYGSTGTDEDGSGPECHHMRTGLNALDTPQVDVLVLVPVSPTAERDMRIMRQAVEMWEGGIDTLAERLELDWLAEGVDFHVTVDAVDLTGEGGGEFTTYPVVDPEIVVVATNPVGGLGIGIDPVDFASRIGLGGGEGLCHGVANPFDFEAWDALPGFDSHHEERSGTYTEDCGGAGGNICFAVNGAIDPTPGDGPLEDFFALFDLVSHEVGHCLTVGHVGDGAEGDWGLLPSDDIMAYSADPGPGLSKCVSTLDVEGFAVRMSKYLDVNGDGVVDASDELQANDQVGQGGNAFQVQRPQDHSYASTTGSALDCPQPDLGLLPGPRTDWTPDEPAEAEEQRPGRPQEPGRPSEPGRPQG